MKFLTVEEKEFASVAIPPYEAGVPVAQRLLNRFQPRDRDWVRVRSEELWNMFLTMARASIRTISF